VERPPQPRRLPPEGSRAKQAQSGGTSLSGRDHSAPRPRSAHPYPDLSHAAI